METLGLPRAECPEEIGLSSARLQRITARIQADVERGLIPGAVVAIAREGRVGYAEAAGWRDREAGAPMRLDAIFRIASMTKPLTSVAAMILAEEGRLDIAAPVARYLPEFADRTIGVERRPAQRLMAEEQTNAELIEKLARLPLMFEPGTTWEYGMSTDVLGRVVEVVSGQSLGEFFAARITGPLRMSDTGFAATGARAARLAEPQIDRSTGARPPMRNVAVENRWQSGGGGAVSTASDYLRFCQMLLDGGALDGTRLLSPKTVAHMTSDHLPPDVRYGATTRERFGALAPVPEMGYGFGLGFAVRKETGRSPVPGSVGEYFWGGVTGTYFWIDPAERLITVLMMQAPDQRLHYRYLIRALVYAAITG